MTEASALNMVPAGYEKQLKDWLMSRPGITPLDGGIGNPHALQTSNEAL
jgi:hypothetical protein